MQSDEFYLVMFSVVFFFNIKILMRVHGTLSNMGAVMEIKTEV